MNENNAAPCEDCYWRYWWGERRQCPLSKDNNNCPGFVSAGKGHEGDEKKGEEQREGE